MSAHNPRKHVKKKDRKILKFLKVIIVIINRYAAELFLQPILSTLKL